MMRLDTIVVVYRKDPMLLVEDDCGELIIIFARVGGVEDREANLEELLPTRDVDLIDASIGIESGRRAQSTASHDVELSMSSVGCRGGGDVERGTLEAALVESDVSGHLFVAGSGDWISDLTVDLTACRLYPQPYAGDLIASRRKANPLSRTHSYHKVKPATWKR